MISKISTSRVIVTKSIYHANGDLKVSKGATGDIRFVNQGYFGIVFDSEQSAFVKPDGSGRLSQDVPALNTSTLAVGFRMIKSPIEVIL